MLKIDALLFSLARLSERSPFLVVKPGDSGLEEDPLSTPIEGFSLIEQDS
ncbi:hypothetical protein NDI44_24700 [Trichocoleus sp. DQ-A3]|nr:hypothetical protein [Coleofasciculus sp. FACHB-125]MBD1899464.1 hypothetical protein [Coleofasciculus sp. FACHB-125]